MSKSFLTVQEAVGLLDSAEDDDDCAMVLLPPENQGDVANEKKNDENSVQQNLTVQDVTG